MTQSSSSSFDPSQARLLLQALQAEWTTRESQRQLFRYQPYSKQAEFHEAGKTYRERLLMAGNQLGKTLAAGMEVAMHVTGVYPDWWIGRRFSKPVAAWCAGVTGESTRDNVQRILLGRTGSLGTGSIPKAAILDVSPARGLSGAVDTIRVQHVAGVSQIALKSYEKGREKWQGETLDFVWFDEEPPEDIYTEGLTRTNATGGMTMLTFTPLLGMSSLVTRFLQEKPPGVHITSMTIHDVTHYSEQQRAEIIASYPEFERDARTKGIPQLGSGRVFPLDEDDIKVKPFQIPDHWARIGGLDFGWDHPCGAIQLAHDRDSDCIYVISARRARRETPAMFGPSVMHWGPIPWAWPHDGLQHDKGSGEQLAKQYAQVGMKMLPVRATFSDGTNGVEAGVTDMLDRMQTGRLKVFENLTEWFEEFRLYHRQEGIIVKLNDDLLSATRYAIMMIRHAQPVSQRARNSFGPSNIRPDGLSWMAS